MMMNAMEKLKLTRELRQLVDAIPAQKGMEKLSSAKRLRKLIELLGGKVAEAINELYQSIIDGKTEVSVELLQKVRAEAEKNLQDPLLINAVNVLIAQVNDMVGTAE
ncbi:MAG: hypothetical protein RSC68_07435 [Acinetobacter sp.]